MGEAFFVQQVVRRVRERRGAGGRRAKPGWYRRRGESTYTFWDGESWTEHTADELPPPGTTPG